MFSRTREIWYALVAIILVTVVYLVAYRQAGTFPAAAGLVGHGIGIFGFVLMVMTESLYSIRKQLTDARWGSIASWLRAHIVTGLVGPYMVLLHTAMRFQGLAGIAMLLTLVTVVSGVVGRYVYTAVPREVEGADPDTSGRLAAVRGALATWRSIHVPLTWALFAVAFIHAAGALYYATLLR